MATCWCLRWGGVLWARTALACGYLPYSGKRKPRRSSGPHACVQNAPDSRTQRAGRDSTFWRWCSTSIQSTAPRCSSWAIRWGAAAPGISGAKYAEYWKAIAPMSGPFVEQSTYPWDRIRKMPVFMTEGTGATPSLAGSRAMQAWMKSQGFPLGIHGSRGRSRPDGAAGAARGIRFLRPATEEVSGIEGRSRFHEKR